jgi:alanine dehydrogenase
MIIGIPKEIKVDEHRVAAPPTASASHLSQSQGLCGNERRSGQRIRMNTWAAGATVVHTAEEVWSRADWSS